MKFVINEGYGDVENVEGASYFQHQDGFFYFFDRSDSVVFAIAAGGVRHIKREDAPAS